MSSHARTTLLFLAWLGSLCAAARADEIHLVTGVRDASCLVRDEGAWVRVWWEPQEFPIGGERIPRELVRSFSYASGPSFDEDLPLADLCVTHVEILPRKTSYQGLDPEALVAVSARAKLRWEPGEELRFVAHVVNTGRSPATEFAWVCSIDGVELGRGRVAAGLEVRGERTFEVRWPYVAEARELHFWIEPSGEELSRANDARREELEAWAIACVVPPKTVSHFHQRRNVCGTFSVEHHVQWHLDLVNGLLAASPGADGHRSCRARVRLDRIVYASSSADIVVPRAAQETPRGDQGCLLLDAAFFGAPSASDSPARFTSWVLVRQLLRELGGLSAFDLDERPAVELATTGAEVARLGGVLPERSALARPAWAKLFRPSCTAYLDRCRGLPRGVHGERLLLMPAETWLRFRDGNGDALSGAIVSLLRCGVRRRPSSAPEVLGATDSAGRVRLPDRAGSEASTPHGWRSRPSPFGTIDDRGQGALLLARVERAGRSATFWISCDELNTHALQSGETRCELELVTDFASADGPAAPRDLRFDVQRRRVMWSASPSAVGESRRERYRVFQRAQGRDLREAPWQLVREQNGCESVGVNAHADEVVYGVSAIDERGRSSEIVELFAPLPQWVGELRYDDALGGFVVRSRSRGGWYAIDGPGRWRPCRAPQELASAATPVAVHGRVAFGRAAQRLTTPRGDALLLHASSPWELELRGPAGALLRRWEQKSGLQGRGLVNPSHLCSLPWGEVALFDAATGEIVCFDPYAPAASDDPLPLVKDGVFAHPVWYEEPVLQPKVLVLNFDPLVADGAGGELRLSKHAGWNDPRLLAEEYRRDLHSASGGYVKHRIVEWRDLDVYPRKVDGFAYDDASYLAAKAAGQWHDPDRLDYAKLVEEHGLAALVANGTVDEVWMFGGPAFGFYETQMVGPKAYWCNSPGLDVEEVQRLFVIFGFNYERGVAEMIHDLGHMTESILSHVYEPQVGKWRAEKRRSAWERFSAYDAKHPGLGGVGNCHFPVNGEKDYDYANPRAVPSNAADWKLWPLPLPEPRLTPLVSCETWGGPDHHRSYQRWFFAHLPRRAGRAPDGRLANWWEYLFHLNAHPESRGR
ncbi:MAG: hypothetical protein IPN34_10850 [Planctomycetes bacterium]|nr:hypothetical protein [Planctomycetota bacterium]